MGSAIRPRLRVISGSSRSQTIPSSQSPLVIAHVLRSLEIGAPAQLALDLARSQRQSGNGVLLISLASPSPAPMASDFRAIPIPIHIVPRRSRFDTSLPLRIALLLRKRRVDVVHTHDPIALPFGSMAGRIAGATVIHTERGDRGSSSWSAWARVQASRLLDGCVSISEQGVRLANRWGVGGRTLLECVAQAVDLETFRPNPESREQVRRKLGIDSNSWVIGSVGLLTKPKHHALLLRAVAPLLGKDTSLLVVGAGPEKNTLRILADRLRVGQYVRFTGARRDVDRMMAAMDVFALPSTDGDLPLVVPEAMATGLPIVAPQMGSIPTVVVDGETGWVVPPGNEEALRSSLFQLRSSKDTSRRMGERARRVARTRFSLDRMHRQYDRIYRSFAQDGL